MKCRYCNIALAPLRSLTDGEFCCDDHRHAFHEDQSARTEVMVEPPQRGVLFALPLEFYGAIPPDTAAPIGCLEPREFKPTAVKPAAGSLSPMFDTTLLVVPETVEPDPPVWEQVFGLQFSAAAANAETGIAEDLPAGLEFPGIIALPHCDLYPAAIPVQSEPEFVADPVWEPKPSLPISSHPALKEEPAEPAPVNREVAASWHWLRDAWRNAPNDLKIVTILLPVLLALALGPLTPKVKGRFTPPSIRSLPSLKALPSLPVGNVQQVVSTRLKNLHETILNRAAVDFTDDFRSGLDAWDSRSNLTSSWSYDASGFVQPGPLAVFKPTSDMTDYRFQFLGEIDQKGLGAAFRAADLDNYYAVKLAVAKPGPLPLVRLVRYAVINGKEERHSEKPLPLATRPDTLYRMVVDVRGSDFTILVQGQVVDFWSDQRISRGGVGFFCGRGEKARVRWVEVSHQYDALGRLCAYLAPYGFEGRNGNFN